MYSEIYLSYQLFNDPTPSYIAQYNVMAQSFRNQGLEQRKHSVKKNIILVARRAERQSGKWAPTITLALGKPGEEDEFKASQFMQHRLHSAILAQVSGLHSETLIQVNLKKNQYVLPSWT